MLDFEPQAIYNWTSFSSTKRFIQIFIDGSALTKIYHHRITVSYVLIDLILLMAKYVGGNFPANLT